MNNRLETESQLLYEQLRHTNIRHFVILECLHLANGCVLKCGCIGLMLFHNLSCLGTIICYINTIGIVRIKMWLHRFDVISQSIMSGHNNMLYKYYRNCSDIGLIISSELKLPEDLLLPILEDNAGNIITEGCLMA